MKKINQPLFQYQSRQSLISDLYKQTFSIHDGLIQIRLVSMAPESELPSISAWTERIGLILEGEVNFKAEMSTTVKKTSSGSEVVLAGVDEDENISEENDEQDDANGEKTQKEANMLNKNLFTGDGFYLPPNLKDKEFKIEPVTSTQILLVEHAFAGIDDHHVPDYFRLISESETNKVKPFNCLHQGQLDNLHVYGLTLKPGQRFELNSHTGQLLLLPVDGQILTADTSSMAIELPALTPAWKSDTTPMLIYAGEKGANVCIIGLGDLCEITQKAF